MTMTSLASWDIADLFTVEVSRLAEILRVKCIQGSKFYYLQFCHSILEFYVSVMVWFAISQAGLVI